MNRLIEGLHYYINEDGLVVLTEKFLRERGYCCTNGCRHCPYGYKLPYPVKPRKTDQERKENTPEAKSDNEFEP